MLTIYLTWHTFQLFLQYFMDVYIGTYFHGFVLHIYIISYTLLSFFNKSSYLNISEKKLKQYPTLRETNIIRMQIIKSSLNYVYFVIWNSRGKYSIEELEELQINKVNNKDNTHVRCCIHRMGICSSLFYTLTFNLITLQYDAV